MIMNNSRIIVKLIGEQGVGKSSIHYRFCENNYDPPHQSTFGLIFKTQYIEVKGITYIITLWDTFGDEKYRQLSPDYYEDAQVTLIVYDTTNRETFEALQFWVGESKKHGKAKQIIILVGNMIDKINEQQVTYDEANSYAIKIGVSLKLISCKENQGIDELYESIVLNFKGKTEADDSNVLQPPIEQIQQKQNN